MTCSERVIVENVRVWDRRPPRGPGVRTQTVSVFLPMSSPATRSYRTSTSDPLLTSTTCRASSGGPSMQGHRPARSRQQSRAPEDPAPNTSAGSPAPVTDDVAGRQKHSHRQGLRSRSQRITPPGIHDDVDRSGTAMIGRKKHMGPRWQTVYYLGWGGKWLFDLEGGRRT